MELDKALQLAVMGAWDELPKNTGLSSARVDYMSKPGSILNDLHIWGVKAWGDCDWVCDYWMYESPTHPAGIDFRNGSPSAKLAESLEFIMKNQDQFTRRAEGGSVGLVLINPPTVKERIESGAWMKKNHDALPKSLGTAA